MFDVERVGNSEPGVKIEESALKMKILADQNRERFDTLKGVVAKWLDRNGRQWVQMDSLFAFALKA